MRDNKRMRQHHPKHILERFAAILNQVFPNFYNKELPDNLYDMVMELHEHGDIVADGDLSKIEKIKKLTGVADYLKFIADVHSAYIKKISYDIENKASYAVYTDNNTRINKRINQQDLAYLAGAWLNDGETIQHAELSRAELTHHLIETSWDFNDSGNKIFRVGERLTEELINTEISKISSEFLELPYQTILLHIPYNTKLTTHAGLLKWVYIGEYFESDNTKAFKLIFVDVHEVPHISEFEFTDGDIFPQLKRQCKELYKSKIAVGEHIALMQFIASVILYLNSRELHTTIIPPLPQSVISKETRSKYPVCVLGMDIDISPSRCADYSSTVTETKNKNEINVLKWMVRGHFRNQAKGQGRERREIIWIRPYIKGKERENEDISTKPANYILK